MFICIIIYFDNIMTYYYFRFLGVFRVVFGLVCTIVCVYMCVVSYVWNTVGCKVNELRLNSNHD